MTLKTRNALEFRDGTGAVGRVEWDSVEKRFSFKVDGTIKAYLDDTLGLVLADGTPFVRTSRKLIIPALHGKVGATSGWVITAGTNLSLATLPASQTSSTLIIPILGLEVGDTLNSLEVHGQVDSGGNAVTVVASARKITTAVAGHADAEIGATTIADAVVADTLLDGTSGLVTITSPEVMAAAEQVYLLLTGTTLGTTDVEISHIVANITKG